MPADLRIASPWRIALPAFLVLAGVILLLCRDTAMAMVAIWWRSETPAAATAPTAARAASAPPTACAGARPATVRSAAPGRHGRTYAYRHTGQCGGHLAFECSQVAGVDDGRAHLAKQPNQPRVHLRTVTRRPVQGDVLDIVTPDTLRRTGHHLERKVGVPQRRIAQIHNGVDIERFHPHPGGRAPIAGCPFTDPALFMVGTVGRMQTVKAQTALVLQPALRERLRLVMVGDGPLRAEAQSLLDAAGVGRLAWLPGARADVPDVMRGLDCFVLPALAGGISNTILEAMASGLPALATEVGGNAELVVAGQAGEVVPAADIEAMAASLIRMATDLDRAAAIGRAGREVATRRFSLPSMVAAYQGLYDRLLAERTTRPIRD